MNFVAVTAELIEYLELIVTQVKINQEYCNGSDENLIDFWLDVMHGKSKVSKEQFLVAFKAKPGSADRWRSYLNEIVLPILVVLDKLILRCKSINNIPNLSEQQKQKMLDSIAEDIRIYFKAMKFEFVFRMGKNKDQTKDDEIEELYNLLGKHTSRVQKIIEYIFPFPLQQDVEDKFEDIRKGIELGIVRQTIQRLLDIIGQLKHKLTILVTQHPSVTNALSQLKEIIVNNQNKLIDPACNKVMIYEIKYSLAECYMDLSEISNNINCWYKEQQRLLKQQRKESAITEADDFSKTMATIRAMELRQTPSLEDLAEDHAIEAELAEIIRQQNAAAQAIKQEAKAHRQARFAANQQPAASSKQQIDQEKQELLKLENIILNSEYYSLLALIFDSAEPKNGTLHFQKILSLAKKCQANVECNGGDHVVFRFKTDVGSASCSIPKINHHGHGRHKVLGIYIEILRETLVSVGITPDTVQEKSRESCVMVE